MKQMMNVLKRLNCRSGQSLVEYALILALISVVAILVLKGICTSVNTKRSLKCGFRTVWQIRNTPCTPRFWMRACMPIRLYLMVR